MTVPDRTLGEKVAAAAVRGLMRATGLSQHTLAALRRGERVRYETPQRVIAAVNRQPSA